MFILPVVQFLGAAIMITFLYSTLTFSIYLPVWTTHLLGLNFLLARGFICFILHMGSQPILKSSKVLRHWKLYSLHCKCKWTRKFLRSCPKIVLRIGCLHKLNQCRATNLMRFVSQGTIFLVKSTGKLDTDSISLPSWRWTNLFVKQLNKTLFTTKICYFVAVKCVIIC